MFEINSILQNKNHNSYVHLNNKRSVQSTHPSFEFQQLKQQSIEFRKKLHRVLMQNFELKELLSKMQNQKKYIEEQNIELKEQIKMLLQQLNSSDQRIDKYQDNMTEVQNSHTKIQEQLAKAYLELQHSKQTISKMGQHTQNLEKQIQFMSGIKNKLAQDLDKIKSDNRKIKFESEQLQKQNQAMKQQINILNEDITMLQIELGNRKKQIDQYQIYYIEKINEMKIQKQTYLKCLEEKQILKNKCSKYKKKSAFYKQQKEQLALEIQHANIQIESNTFRKYFSYANH